MSMGDLREYGGRVIMGAMYYAIPFFFYYKNVNKHSPFLFFSLLIFCCVILKAAMILNMAKKLVKVVIYILFLLFYKYAFFKKMIKTNPFLLSFLVKAREYGLYKNII